MMESIVDGFDLVTGLIFIGSVVRFCYLGWFKKENSVRMVQLAWFSVIMALLGIPGDVIGSIAFGDSWWGAGNAVFITVMSTATWRFTEKKFQRSLVS